MAKSIKGRASGKVIGQGVAAKSRAAMETGPAFKASDPMTISDASAADRASSIVMLIEIGRAVEKPLSSWTLHGFSSACSRTDTRGGGGEGGGGLFGKSDVHRGA